MGFKTEFNWVLKLKPEQGLDENNLVVGSEYDFTKSDYRTYPVDIPLQLVNQDWEVIGLIEIIGFQNKDNKTSGRYKILKIYYGEEKQALTQQTKELSQLLKQAGAVSNEFNNNNNSQDFLKQFQESCKRTVKDFPSDAEEIMTWGLGIAGEAGDVAGCIKKTFSHHNDQIAGIRENIGDTMWYVANICNFFDWNLSDILNENIEKLKKRFPDGFTVEDASRGGTRIDWNEDSNQQ
jgi:NTP pyrophosphatase (non-canonical NTP hydrolase)